MKSSTRSIGLAALIGVALGVVLRLAIDESSGPSAGPPVSHTVTVHAATDARQAPATPSSPSTASWGWTDQLTAQQLEQDVGSERFRRWVVGDPDAALKRVQSIPNVELRIKALEALMGELADHDLDQARSLIAPITDPTNRYFLLKPFAAAWAKRDAAAAWNYTKSLSGEDLEACQFGVIRTVVHDDPKAAATMVELLPEGVVRRSEFMEIIAKEWSYRDPRAAAEFAIKNPSPYGYGAALTNTLRNWTNQDADAAIDWMKQLPAGKGKDRSAFLVFDALFVKEPQEALAIFSELDVESMKSASGTIARNLIAENSQRALQWWEGLPDDQVKATAAQALAVSWTDKNPGAAVQWTKTLPPGKNHDQAVAGVFLYLEDPQMGVELAATVSDEHERQKYLRRWATAWLKEDAKAATNWINSTPALTKEMRTDLLAK